MPNFFQLQFEIQDSIDEILHYTCNEAFRITIESFKRKKDFLVIFRVGNREEKYHFFKSAISVKPNNARSFKQFRRLVSFVRKFSHERTWTGKANIYLYVAYLLSSVNLFINTIWPSNTEQMKATNHGSLSPGLFIDWNIPASNLHRTLPTRPA